MAILKVAQMGHPVLRRVADDIDPTVIPTERFQRVCEDILETMEEYDGAGLAAPQVHLSVRVVALTLDEESGPEIWVNPVITPLTEDTASMYEGCLSVENMRGRVSRPARIHVSMLDREGAPHALVLQGFPAVVAQHECDPLDGVLYVDRVDPRTLAFLPEYRRFGQLHRYEALLAGEAEDVTEDDAPDDVANWQDEVVEVDPELTPLAADAVARNALEE